MFGFSSGGGRNKKVFRARILATVRSKQLPVQRLYRFITLNWLVGTDGFRPFRTKTGLVF